MQKDPTLTDLKQKIRALEQTLTETRAQLEQALQSESKYRSLVEDISAVIFTTDAKGLITYISPHIESMVGYSPDDLIGHHFSDFIFEKDLSQALKGFQKVLSGTVHPREYRIVSPEGKTLWIRTLSRPTIHEENILGIQGVFTDVTDQKNVEASLRKSEEKYHSIIENIAEGYFEVDLAGNLTFFNEPLCGIFGYAPEELMGMNNRTYTSPETARKMFQIFNRVYRTGEPATIADYEVFKKDGSRRILELSAYLMHDQEGRPSGFRGFIRDMSERKQADREKQKLSAQIQQVNKMESIGTLANGIAHDFNNLLMGIQGNTALLQREIDASKPAFQKLQRIQQCVEDGISLTHQLLGFAGGSKFVVMPTNINKVVKHTARLFVRSRPELQIRASYADDLWIADVDRVQMGQALLNLYLNAHQSMPQGGNLHLRTSNVDIDRQHAQAHDVRLGKYVRIEVTDEGEGMPPDVQKRVFEPFFSARETGQNAGLGLSSAYGIIKNHRGLIDVTSTPGVGTTFAIYLPTSDEPATEASAHES
jgi:PAS domain S-box-containing protein